VTAENFQKLLSSFSKSSNLPEYIFVLMYCIVLSTKAALFLPVSVCQLTGLCKKFLSDFHKTLYDYGKNPIKLRMAIW